MKFKEFFKTIILTVLVISSLVLSSKIWFSKELWPEGYNSFNYTSIFSKLFSAFNKNNSKALELSQIFSPKQILINKNSRNILILPDHKENENLNNLLKENLKTVISKGTFSVCNEDEFKKACEADSVFIDFYNQISLEMLADYYGTPVSSEILEIYSVKHILFSISEESKLNAYIKNDKTGKTYKAEVKMDTSKLHALCEDLVKKVPEGNIPASFAFKNNFDKKLEEDSGKLLLNSYMLINLDASSISNITPNLFIDVKNSPSPEYYAEVLKCFNVKTSSARRFADTSGTVNYVENYATLKFHSDGLLQYTSANESAGVELKGSFTSDYDVVKMVGEFTASLNNNFKLPSDNKYIFAGVTEGEDMKYTVYFDILYKGVPVILNRKISDTETLTHAIEIEFSNGKIISYKQLLSGFTGANNSVTVSPMITALDGFYTTYDVKKNPDVVINDIYHIYHYNPSTSKVEIKNAVSLSNQEVVIVSQ